MSKKLLVLIVIAGLVGGILGSAVTASVAQASVWDSVLQFLKTGRIGPATSTTSSTASGAPALYQPVADYESAVIQAVELASPSVVSVVVSKDLPVIEQCPYTVNPFSDLPPDIQQFFGNDLGPQQYYAPCQKGTANQEVGGGSGFIISSDGLILTNKHVVADTSADYTVLTNDGQKHPATVVARDPVKDLAVLRIQASGLPVVTLGDSSGLKLGQTSIAIGNALGEFRNTVSVGVISGLARTITASGDNGAGTETLSDVIQTDAAINPGNSGGPLLNLRGEVIGINTAIVSGAQNLGFAIPINAAKQAIASVKASGKIQTPYIGVRYLPVDDTLSQQEKLPVNYGALLRGNQDGPAVVKGSPAAQAGLQAEDIILEVDGTKVDSTNSLVDLIGKYNVGDTVTLKVQRGTSVLTVSVKLTDRPAGQ